VGKVRESADARSQCSGDACPRPGREGGNGREREGSSGVGEASREPPERALAAIAAAIALLVDWWLALLIVFLGLVLLVLVLGAVSRALLRKTGSLRPEQAMEEARRTKDVLRGFGVG
jgi:hypothetical protein